MKNLLVITLFFLSSTIFSQSVLSWFKPVEEYSCKCDRQYYYGKGRYSCNNLMGLIFQEGRRLESTAIGKTVDKVILLTPPSEWSIVDVKGLKLLFDSITKEATVIDFIDDDRRNYSVYSCKKAN